MSQPDPANIRDYLPSQLRRLRNAVGMTQRQVADALDWSQSKMLRIESGSVGISVADLQMLLNLYRADSDTATELIVNGQSFLPVGGLGFSPVAATWFSPTAAR